MNLIKSKPSTPRLSYPRMAAFFRVLNAMMRYVPSRSKYQADLIVFRKNLFPGAPEQVQFDGFTLRRAMAHDLHAIKAHPERFMPEVYRNRLEDGHAVYCAVQGDEVAAFLWVNFDVFSHLHGTKHEAVLGTLEKDEGCFYDSYTYRQYRGLGLAPILLNYAAACLANAGVATLIACVPPSNLSCVVLYQGQGFGAIDVLHLYQIGSLRQCLRGTRKELTTLNEWIGSCPA
ncbi:MAG TPA: GNAT family N-acetyltransferase [Verrucomicrobiae bacterium]|jgi:ribosomal protein S18 acetylase RimI-like enzyme|nr:GNAT family N-acetyltransferase [Verrucomicrobiae bacterium]